MEQDLGYVMDAVRLIRRELDGQVPLIGSPEPWTLACYMVGRRWQQGLCAQQGHGTEPPAGPAPACWRSPPTR